MKKMLLLFLVAVCSFGAKAQDVDYERYYQGVDTYKDLNLSSDQISKIKKLQREVGPKFAAIGRDRSISGYEKGQRKRELAMKHRVQIRAILSDGQMSTLEKKYGPIYEGDRIKDAISDNYDDRLDALEDKYDAQKDAIKDDPRLDKYEKKARVNALKQKYKAEKAKLKAEKSAAKNGLFR